MGSDKRYARWGATLLLALSQCSTSFGYFFVQWNRRFYDALEAKDSVSFFQECLVFAGLAFGFVLIYSLTRYYSQQYALRWRMWMTETALAKWTQDQNRGKLEGSDQRIQEDLMRFTLIFERFFMDCFNAVLFIIVLIPTLFTHTRNLFVRDFDLGWVILFVAIGYTLLGMLVSAKVANPLINLEYDNQKLEAEFRYNLVHVRDGATRPEGFFKQILNNLTINYNHIYRRQKNFNLWQKAYDQFSFLIPFLLLVPNYFAGLITLGSLMQIKSIFSRIRNSMAYLLDHYTELTELMAISKRLVEFNQNINPPTSLDSKVEVSSYNY